MNYREEIIKEYGYTICALCQPYELTYCENCNIYNDFKESYKNGNSGNK